MTKVSISFTTDQATKTQLDRIAKELGLSTSSLLNILVKRTVAVNGIPFDVKAHNLRQLNQFDEETQTEIIKELAIEKGLLPDDSTVVADVEQYFEDLGY
ncbi:type II toxin-antitoxin system RelB/DinJ family antitoxin [Ligilactobacillus agilis]|uniref:type II toxin-antitoxin system RelB/DinJ family antitoxin n=1 Tax=Ligilactobacillus agilis TaxID=1601 RepID=UPI0019583884|nr:type II toxin-antitoxin system RelB/DinJ family antitoxin [Ligilactobacillus agilis]MBM6772929.1 type II toxin-antitoxin system RelB/DinJ family antitoxin [Ligilactobacillus agilis]